MTQRPAVNGAALRRQNSEATTQNPANTTNDPFDGMSLSKDAEQGGPTNVVPLPERKKVVLRAHDPVKPVDPELAATRINFQAPDLVERLKASFQRVNESIIGREELSVQTMLAILCREHQLIYSRAGMAKSLFAETVFSQFSGGKTFKIQLTKGTTEEGMVGAVNIEELKRGNVIHNTNDTLVDANLAFIDEFFDANDVTLRSTLGILNERVFNKGKQRVEAELHTAIATTNYVRSSDITEAVVDRFAFRARLDPDPDPYNQLRVDEVYGQRTGKVARPQSSELISMDELEFLSDIVEGRVPDKRISAPAHVLVLKNAIIDEYIVILSKARQERNMPGAFVSPRTRAKTRDVLNASALLDGREQLHVKDLKALRFMVPTLGDELETTAFAEATKKVLDTNKRGDTRKIDDLMQAHEVLEMVLRYRREGVEIEPSFFERIKIFLGITSIGNLTFDSLREKVTGITSQSDTVTRLREAFLKRLQREQDQMDGKRTSMLT